MHEDMTPDELAEALGMQALVPSAYFSLVCLARCMLLQASRWRP